MTWRRQLKSSPTGTYPREWESDNMSFTHTHSFKIITDVIYTGKGCRNKSTHAFALEAYYALTQLGFADAWIHFLNRQDQLLSFSFHHQILFGCRMMIRV